MNDMTSVIVPKSDQINADDLIGRTMTITIREVRINGGQEQPVSIYFEKSDKAFRPCKSMSRVLVAGWGPDANKYVGRSLTLFRDATVKWGGMEVGGIRISHMSHLENGAMTLALTATKGSRKPFKVLLLQVPAAGQGGAPAELTFEQAEAAVKSAQTMVELRQIWNRDNMRPHRRKLQEALGRKQDEIENPATGRPDEDHGDQHDGTDRITDELVDGFDR